MRYMGHNWRLAKHPKNKSNVSHDVPYSRFMRELYIEHTEIKK